jgi:ATP-dependent Lhr-like helicase
LSDLSALAEEPLSRTDALSRFSKATSTWFRDAFDAPTPAQRGAWPAILDGQSTLLVAPTGSGKTLAAFLCALDRLLFSPEPDKLARCRVLYVSPLKALAVDVERNLRAPLAGIERTADRLGILHRTLDVSMRTGDTPAAERARFQRRPGDILITTPESLYLLLTSQARETLRSVETVIIDEIHALAPQKRGSHLFLSLERLEALRDPGKRLQRIGLSATQKPLEEIAKLLGGFEEALGKGQSVLVPRPVEIVDARSDRHLELTIEVPVEDMGSMKSADTPGALRDKAADGSPRSIWMSIHPRLVELVRAHRSTMIFVNNRRLAERLSSAINETAGEPLSRAHHGSVAREQRVEIEDALKSGTLPCIVATSSLELGLDIGAVELVVQIESPPSVSSGIQRVGRANHHVGGNPRGTLFPKHRGDLVACAEAARRMRSGEIEETRYPRNPVDVLAQQMVAIVASEDSMQVDALYALVRRAAPFAELTRTTLDGVLDMLTGRYPSDEFAELRPRLTWHRSEGLLEARKGAKRLAIVNAGVIPDRGLYGVFLADGDEKKSRRVGELDEEMVFEAREGEVFVLGASSWRIQEITHDRVLVTPAPGEPGKMPFWHGDRMGRSVELGRGIGALLRHVSREDDAAAEKRLATHHFLSDVAAKNLVRYVREQEESPYLLPTDRQIVVERFVDEVGDTRVCVLSPFGARVHAPLSICIAEKARLELGTLAESVYTDDGIVLRFPEAGEVPDIEALLPSPDEIEELLVNALGQTALFASHFRECAGRALLLPRRHPGKRSPLWAQRKRAADLLQVASRYGSFPILLETYRECLKDVFDVPSLTALMTDVKMRKLRVATVDADKPSPFSVNLLFSYVGNFIYEADAPLAERRAAALTIDHTQLRELLGQVELRELLDPVAVADVSHMVARLAYPPKHPDELHDLLLFLGDLSQGELAARLGERVDELVTPLLTSRRAVRVRIASEERVIAAEDTGRYLYALGVMPPAGMPLAFLEKPAEPLVDLLSRYARTHGPFRGADAAQRYGLPVEQVALALDSLVVRGRVLRGELHPEHAGEFYCDAEVLRSIKRRSLAALRKEIEPVDRLAYARFLLRHHGILRSSRGLDTLRKALERLEGAPLALGALERDILPARVVGFLANDLDHLLASGELVWRGVEASASGAGRIALYFRDHFEELAPPATRAEGPLVDKIRATLEARGAVFFHDLAKLVGAFPHDVLDALWELVWAGEVTNDTLQPLRSLARNGQSDRKRGVRVSRVLPGSEGRWTLLPVGSASETVRRAGLVRTLLTRHGVLVREALKAEGVAGGFSAVYEVLRALEEAGRVRRGYFIEGLGAAQFAEPGADEVLRSEREPQEPGIPRLLAATDPASPWGAALPWPARDGARPMRADGAHVILGDDARLLGWLGRSERSLLTFFEGEPRERAAQSKTLAEALARAVDRRLRTGFLIAQVDGEDVASSDLAGALASAGFQPTSRGYLKRAPRPKTEDTADDMDAELAID